MDSATEDRQELVRNCQNFLVPDHEDGPYKRVLEHDVLTTEKLETGKLRLDIKLQDVQDFQQHLHQRLVTDPEAVIRAFEIAVEDTVRNLFPKTLQEDQQIKIGIVGELGPHTVSPRALSCAHISKLVRVEGIVTKCSLVRPKVVKSVHYCEKTRQFTTKEYRDVTSNSGQPTGAVYPQRDDQGNPLTTEFGLCKYKDHQTVIVQELPETAPAGQLPCSTEASSFHSCCPCCLPFKCTPIRVTQLSRNYGRPFYSTLSVGTLTKDHTHIRCTACATANRQSVCLLFRSCWRMIL